jgi:hypothetical protein
VVWPVEIFHGEVTFYKHYIGYFLNMHVYIIFPSFKKWQHVETKRNRKIYKPHGCYDRPEACFGLKSRTADRETGIWTG